MIKLTVKMLEFFLTKYLKKKHVSVLWVVITKHFEYNDVKNNNIVINVNGW